MQYKISVIMPALNEENNISQAVENVIKSFDQLDVHGEIVVVNDGSTDRTREIVEELIEKYPFIQLICHDKPKGIGASYWEGIVKSRGEIVTMLPGDAENDAHEILCYLPLMEHVDVVIPFIYNQNVRSWKRRMISKFYKGIINLSFGMLLNYMNGSVMYRKCALQNITLKSSGFFYQTELLIKSIKSGYLYAEVPCALQQRMSGKSKALTFKSLRKVTRGYLSTMAAVYVFDRKRKPIVPDSVTALRHSQLNKIEIN
ncbi:MAG: glycosyltransferase family 2 protein [Candidatus Brocadiales bacterium]|nr:glycosyltransferase family 2 protein [Candidatus Brocadiales bacterium]